MLSTPPEIRVLGAFEVLVGGVPAPVPMHAQRVLAYLAVTDQAQRREVLAGRLWAESSQAQAHARLRNTLWQVRQVSRALLDTTRDAVRLAADVGVDLAASRLVARRVLGGEEVAGEAVDEQVRLLERDLLPCWDDDWLLLERERTRQLRIHALEALSRVLTARGDFARAIEAAFAAVAAEPLRESARVVLIEAHLAEGNRCEAVRQLASYRLLVREELGLEPSEQVAALIHAPNAGTRAALAGR